MTPGDTSATTSDTGAGASSSGIGAGKWRGTQLADVAAAVAGIPGPEVGRGNARLCEGMRGNARECEGMRDYLMVARGMNCELEQSVAMQLANKFVEMHKSDSSFGAEDFNNCVTVRGRGKRR